MTTGPFPAMEPTGVDPLLLTLNSNEKNLYTPHDVCNGHCGTLPESAG